MNTITTRPNVTVEVKRYDGPDAWYFAHYIKCAWNDPYAEAAIFDNALSMVVDLDSDKVQWYRGRTEGVMPAEAAAKERRLLVTDNFVPYTLNEVDPSVKAFILSCVVPMEWKRPLLEGDEEVASRIQVWIGA